MRHRATRGRRVPHSRRKQEMERRGMDEVELAKLQAFEDLNRGFRSAIKMIIPTVVGLGIIICWYLWYKCFES